MVLRLLRNGVLFLISMWHEKKRLNFRDESENGSGFLNTVRAKPDADFSDLHQPINLDYRYLPDGILRHSQFFDNSFGGRTQ